MTPLSSNLHCIIITVKTCTGQKHGRASLLTPKYTEQAKMVTTKCAHADYDTRENMSELCTCNARKASKQCYGIYTVLAKQVYINPSTDRSRRSRPIHTTRTRTRNTIRSDTSMVHAPAPWRLGTLSRNRYLSSYLHPRLKHCRNVLALPANLWKGLWRSSRENPRSRLGPFQATGHSHSGKWLPPRLHRWHTPYNYCYRAEISGRQPRPSFLVPGGRFVECSSQKYRGICKIPRLSSAQPIFQLYCCEGKTSQDRMRKCQRSP